MSNNHFIFYNNLTSPDADKSVQHMGDNSTTVGEGDDEVIKINIKKVPNDIKKIAIAVTIYKAEKPSQTFGQIGTTFVRVVNAQTKLEAIRYDLVEDYYLETALIMATNYREDGRWWLKAMRAGYEKGLPAILHRYS